eukprot:9745847-Alexandrium_andersonii.AAC.1
MWLSPGVGGQRPAVTLEQLQCLSTPSREARASDVAGRQFGTSSPAETARRQVAWGLVPCWCTLAGAGAASND